ncbi:MAG: alkaline-phosphatase-like protein [Olpidium bornovanus]|uniref:Alkaline-phosphatase-like protein n=1 Tax=Olpidium bornovanus TaxID=278681 RepID=A0A8H8DHK4_9FUNG|nr:MAG: alkaline-phosphatase-like protein [Olpidium bornovanus]
MSRLVPFGARITFPLFLTYRAGGRCCCFAPSLPAAPACRASNKILATIESAHRSRTSRRGKRYTKTTLASSRARLRWNPPAAMLLGDRHRADQHAGVPYVAGEGRCQSLDSCFTDGADDSENAVTLLLSEDRERDGGGGRGADWKRQLSRPPTNGASCYVIAQRSLLIRYLLVVGALVTFTFIALAVAVLAKGKRVNRYPIASNGTHTFGPTTIVRGVVSVDGMRADYLDRGISPVINGLGRSSGKFLRGRSGDVHDSSFPSKQLFLRFWLLISCAAPSGFVEAWFFRTLQSTTFPNHYTIVTGLHPESHGIVGNSFWDPVLNDSFYYSDPNRSWDSKWWGGEPIWVTAVLQGLRSAVCMWPGSSAVIRGTRPTFEIPYNPSVTSNEKVAQVLRWIDEPDISKRPNLIAVYIPNVDQAGHDYGPNSTEVDEAMREVDVALGRLVQALDSRNLQHIVNLVILSDHGMTTTSADDLVHLEDWIDVQLIRELDGFPLGGLWLTDDSGASMGFLGAANLGRLTSLSRPGGRTAAPYCCRARRGKRAFLSVFLTDPPQITRLANLPSSPATQGHVVVVDRKTFPPDRPYPLRGLHGWDNRDPKMRASFVARGPAFKPVRRKPAGEVNFVAPFDNTEVYGLLCRLLHLDAAPNNGTMSGAQSIRTLMK